MSFTTLPPMLHALQEQEVLRPLDAAFAAFMGRLHGKHPPEELLLAAALASRANGEGHICIDLAERAGQPLLTPDGEETGRTCPSLEPWREALEASPVVTEPEGYAPLALKGGRYLFLYRYWRYEVQLAKAVAGLMTRPPLELDMAQLQAGIRHLRTRGNLSPAQEQALIAAARQPFCVISGGPGTGKTTTIAQALTLLATMGHLERGSVALCAPTGKAASRLQEAITGAIERLREVFPVEAVAACLGEAMTIARMLGARPDTPEMRFNEGNRLPSSLIIVDEASMVDLALMAKLFAAVPEGGRVALLGDKDQLASVEPGAVLGDLCRGVGDSAGGTSVVLLKESFRFPPESGIASLAKAINAGDADGAVSRMAAGAADLHWRREPLSRPYPAEFLDELRASLQPSMEARSPKEALARLGAFRILCANRRGPYGVGHFNLVAEAALRASGLEASGPWYHRRPIMITANDYRNRLFNGDVGVIWRNEHGPVACFETDGELRTIPVSRIGEHETVFAMTVHKSQGSEFDCLMLILPPEPGPILTRELLYTGVTRARKQATIIAPETSVRTAVANPLRRHSNLQEEIEQALAKSRG